MLADFALLIEGSLFLIGYLNLPPIYVSSRKHIAPQKWKTCGKNNGKVKCSFPMELIIVGLMGFVKIQNSTVYYKL